MGAGHQFSAPQAVENHAVVELGAQAASLKLHLYYRETSRAKNKRGNLSGDAEF